MEDKIPDARTIWLFREQLTRHELHKTLFERFDQQLVSQGCRAQKGQIVDASFVDVPRQRNSREENAQIKAGETPERFEANPSVKAQKDTQARWARKNQETHFGYKNHIAIDNQHKLIRAYEVTSAEVHDGQKLVDVLSKNTSGPIAPTVVRRMKKNWLLGACAATFTRKANGINHSRKLRNGPIPVNPKCEFELNMYLVL